MLRLLYDQHDVVARGAGRVGRRRLTRGRRTRRSTYVRLDPDSAASTLRPVYLM